MLGIIGAGGHAKVITDILEKLHQQHDFIFFSSTSVNSFFDKYHLYPDSVNNIKTWSAKVDTWHVAIGNPKTRKQKAELLLLHNLSLTTVIHPKSVVSNSSPIGVGSSVLAGAIINPQAIIGENCIVNTSASVDHDCTIGDYVNIGPGSHLAGNVTVGKLTDLGTGTIVIPNVTIGERCTIGAGSVVINDVPNGSVAVGVPARVLKRK